MYDIIQSMSIQKKKGFVQLLDERMPKIEALWAFIVEDVSRCLTAGPYYCLSSYAITLTLNYKKAFPKSIKNKAAIVQYGYIKTKLKNYTKRLKNLSVLIYFDLRPRDLSLHFHGVAFGNNCQIEQFNSYCKRVLGYTCLKPIDDALMWKSYCNSKLCHEVLPVMWDGG